MKGRAAKRTEWAPGVLGNDCDYDGDPMTAVLVGNPSHAASFTFNADGSFDYTPAYHYVGEDSFTYLASDGIAPSTTATVSINVYNNAPTTLVDQYSVKHDTLLTVNAPGVLGNDSDYDQDPITAVLVGWPAHYKSFTLHNDGSFSYAPSDAYVGADSFTYYATDGIADSAITTVSIDVWNHPPVAVDDSGYIAAAGGTLDVPAGNGVLVNDSDPDGDSPLKANIVTYPSHGNLQLFNSGAFTYFPDAGYAGSDSFTYFASDTANASSANATVTITVFRVDTLTVATSPADRTRTKLGVGEEVTCTVVPSSVPPATWSLTGAGTVDPGSGLQTTFTAGDRASTPSVTATIAGQSYTVDFNVVEPSGVTIEQETGTGVWHVHDTGSVGFKGRAYIHPDDVSFQNIEVREGMVVGVGIGYLSFKDGEVHPDGSWGAIGPPPPGMGSKDTFVDTISSGTYTSTPYSNGTFTWPIPWLFRVGSGEEKQFDTVTHQETIDASGNMTISKGGHSESKAFSDPTSGY